MKRAQMRECKERPTVNSSQKFRILWPIDAFDDLPDLHAKAMTILSRSGRKHELEVHPVFVLSPVEIGLAQEQAGKWEEVYAPASKQALAEKLKGIALPGMLEPKVLAQNQHSVKASVDLLERYSEANRCDLVLMGSHGRRGFSRMMLGSFAEEMILRSSAPVLVMGTKSRGWSDRELQILLPTDLSDVHSPIFQQTFALASNLGAKVTVLSAIPRPVEQAFQSGAYLLGGGWISVPNYMSQERERLEALADRALADVAAKDVPHARLVDDSVISVTESVLNHAETLPADLIVMAAQSGRLSAALIGSITRHVVRAAPCAVLVMRDRHERKDAP